MCNHVCFDFISIICMTYESTCVSPQIKCQLITLKVV